MIKSAHLINALGFSRQEMVDRLPTETDVLVIGGGITGVGIARDAAKRGLRTVLLEMDDFASGTSSRSSKLVHGGLRYLEQYEFSLVFEAVSERRILMDLAPHLVNPLGFLFPVYDGSAHQLWFIEAGMWLYDGLSMFRSPKLHQKLRPAELKEREPALSQEGLQGAPLYYDCSTDDARLTLETALDAALHGATVVNYCKAEVFLADPRGRVAGVAYRDRLSGRRYTIRAGVVVNATGPWTDRTLVLDTLSLETLSLETLSLETRALESLGTAALPKETVEGSPPTAPSKSIGPHPTEKLLRPTKGVHVVVPAQRLPVQHAVVCLHPTDQRVLFAIPWGDETYLGTTDTDYAGDPRRVRATREDVRYLLAAAKHYFPRHPLREDDVVSTWAGVRPLVASPAAVGGEAAGITASAVSREHQIVVDERGVVTIAGGKLTTYRRMAREVVDTVVGLLQLAGISRELRSARTDKDPLVGAHGWPASDDRDEVAAEIRSVSRGTISPPSARSLADRYGMRALLLAERCARDPRQAQPLVGGRPEIEGEIDFAVEAELAVRVADILERRTQIYHRTRDQGISIAPRIAERMGRSLGWDKDQQAAEIKRYKEAASVAQRWRDDP